jgi:hypothetical protein
MTERGCKVVEFTPEFFQAIFVHGFGLESNLPDDCQYEEAWRGETKGTFIFKLSSKKWETNAEGTAYPRIELAYKGLEEGEEVCLC